MYDTLRKRLKNKSQRATKFRVGLGEFQAEIHKQASEIEEAAAEIKEQAAEIVELKYKIMKAVRKSRVAQENFNHELVGIHKQMDEATTAWWLSVMRYRIASADCMKQHRNTRVCTPNIKTSSVAVSTALGNSKQSCVGRSQTLLIDLLTCAAKKRVTRSRLRALWTAFRVVEPDRRAEKRCTRSSHVAG